MIKLTWLNQIKAEPYMTETIPDKPLMSTGYYSCKYKCNRYIPYVALSLLECKEVPLSIQHLILSYLDLLALHLEWELLTESLSS